MDLYSVVPTTAFDCILFSGHFMQVQDQHLFSQTHTPLKAQFSGHNTLIWLPESQSQSANIIQNYTQAKQSVPHHTSATFVVPLLNRFHSTLLENKGMQCARIIAKGQKRPGNSASFPYALADKAVPQPNLSSFETTSLTQVFHGQLLPSHATVTCLADSGATHAFCSQSFVAKHKLRMCPSGDMQSVKLADNFSSLHILGTISVQLKLGDARISLEAYVVSGETATFDFILGESVFNKYKAALHYKPRVLALNIRGLISGAQCNIPKLQ